MLVFCMDGAFFDCYQVFSVAKKSKKKNIKSENR